MYLFYSVSGEELCSIFKNDIESWRRLVGGILRHRKFGWGEVKEVKEAVNKNGKKEIGIIVLFNDKDNENIFNTLTFSEGLLQEIKVSEPIYLDILKKREHEHKRLLEEEKKKKTWEHFYTLKIKYDLESIKETDPISLPYVALERMDKGEDITKDKSLIKDLESKKYFQVLAVCYLNTGEIATAGKYWRYAEKPQKALEISETPDRRNNKFILTMRGGAFRDIKNFSEAKICAQSALELDPDSYYPYNLLGGIAFDENEYDKGLSYFDKAEELGSPTRTWQHAKNQMEKSSAAERLKLGEYLLTRDPQEYSWVKNFLSESK